MNPSPPDPAGVDLPPLELFRQELEERVVDLNHALLSLEQAPGNAASLDLLMRALHSLKGAAGIVGLQPLVGLMHRLEGGFAALKRSEGMLSAEMVAVGFQSFDLLEALSRQRGAALLQELEQRQGELEGLMQALDTLNPDPPQAGPGAADPPPAAGSGRSSASANPDPAKTARPQAEAERVVRVEAENLNRIMGLSGELLVEARWLEPFADALAQLRRRQHGLQASLEALRLDLGNPSRGPTHELLERTRQRERECRDLLAERLAELELYALRTTNLAHRLHREVIAANMRPFADALPALPRLVRDLALALGKQARLEVVGRRTLVDRDILQRLEAPLIHLLRNAVDHGLETPADRLAHGKPERGLIRLEALHRGGMLVISLSDDGAGVNEEAVRQRLVSDGLCSPAAAAAQTPTELLTALEQPGFSTAAAVSEVSGRGVGLDAVRAMVNEVGGSLRLSSRRGEGCSVQLQLPLTLSVVRTLLVEIAGEPYAFPLARLDQIVAVEADQLQRIEGREFALVDGVAIGLVAARQLLGLGGASHPGKSLPVVVISDRGRTAGVVVDRHLGEQDLVVRPLDPRLGKVSGVSASALMGDGQPILIIDTGDLMRELDHWEHEGIPLLPNQPPGQPTARRVLIVDDSRVALDLQTRLVRSAGYRVEQASGAAEALLALHRQAFDLLITDVDMPEMDGIALIETLRQDPRYRELPVVVCSSRENDDDRLRGMEAGADYYLGKRDFQGAALLEAVHQLIGPAEEP